MPTCEIKWIDKAGQPTPDSNVAIGRVKMLRHVVDIDGRGVVIPESAWFHICADHKARLGDPGMRDWVFEALEIKD